VKEIWTARVGQAAARYGENVPVVTTCCNACRTCLQTNALAVAFAAVGGIGAALRRRFAKPS
jgi:hypothetical protein